MIPALDKVTVNYTDSHGQIVFSSSLMDSELDANDRLQQSAIFPLSASNSSALPGEGYGSVSNGALLGIDVNREGIASLAIQGNLINLYCDAN